MNTTPVDAMLLIIECLDNQIEAPEEIQSWLLQSLKRYRSGAVKTLDEAFGLAVGPGEARHRLPSIWRTKERNTLIREAAWHLRNDYPKCQLAKIIAHSMKSAVPSVGNREATLLLIKLRNLCMQTRAGKPIDIGERRVLEVMNGDGH